MTPIGQEISHEISHELSTSRDMHERCTRCERPPALHRPPFAKCRNESRVAVFMRGGIPKRRLTAASGVVIAASRCCSAERSVRHVAYCEIGRSAVRPPPRHQPTLQVTSPLACGLVIRPDEALGSLTAREQPSLPAVRRELLHESAAPR